MSHQLILITALTTLGLACTAARAQPPAAAPAQAVCPQLADQLSELLASAKQRVDREAQLRVEFEVDAQGHARLRALDGYRNYRSAVRTAVNSLDCQAGQPQRYVLNIRFEDPSTALARSAAPAASQALARALP